MNREADVILSWLGSPPVVPTGATWGVPWKQGELGRDAVFALHGANGEPVPVQSWPTAYWPDGSVKWTAHAASFAGAVQDGYVLSANPKSASNPGPASPSLRLNVTPDTIEVDTGVLLCRFNRSGSSLIREIIREEAIVCSGGELVGLREEVLQTSGRKTVVEEAFCSLVESAEVEQPGPIRAVVKWKGRHRMEGHGRKWLPFTVRCYLYAGVDAIRFVHTFIYDGNPHQDFIKGLGIRFAVPMSGPLYNRHIRFAGDTGWFSESPQGWIGFRAHERLREWQAQQRDGERIRLDGEQDAVLALLEDMPVWNDFKLAQLSPDSYTIAKRTQPGCSWIRAAAGNRSRGLVYAGSEQGGVAVGVRHFWQKYPASFEVSGCAGEEATVTCWLWSPDAPAMDLRHYDTKTHVRSCYEGADEMRSTPYGIANTSELTLWGCGRTPDPDRLDAMAKEKETPALLVCEPRRYYETKALGFWSLPDRSTPLKAQLEDVLDQLIEFYENEIEQRRWYGFWDYGDVMHSYDPVRHTWKYDIGGCAWQNTELVPNFWLWYMFLRSGREHIFRLAEAMTRHTSEVDVYHIGEYAGLGSRHNVLHWGCGCKEARISMAGLHRFYYYLTADERIGDIMDEVKDADYATVQLDPMRAYFAKDDAFPTHTRSGPDWAAFCSNWMVQWERYEDTAYRDKLLKGIECLKRMPDRLLTGPVFGYNPKTGELMYMGDENYGHHLMICMGGAQVWAELSHLLQDEEWERMLVEYGEFYHLPREEKIRRTDGRIQDKDWNNPMLATAMMAFAAGRKGDRELALQAWTYLLRKDSAWSMEVPLKPVPVPEQEYVRPIREIPWMSTNRASQWSINLIVCLEWIGQYLPESLNLFEGGA